MSTSEYSNIGLGWVKKSRWIRFRWHLMSVAMRILGIQTAPFSRSIADAGDEPAFRETCACREHDVWPTESRPKGDRPNPGLCWSVYRHSVPGAPDKASAYVSQRSY